MIRRARDGGFTLAELLVVITLTGMIGSVVVAVTVTGLRKQSQVQDRADALSQTRTALQRVDRDIRSSNPLESAQGSTIVLQEVQATVTRTVTYLLQADGTKYDLVKKETDVSSTGAAMPAVADKTVLRNVVNPSSSPVFNYAVTSSGYTAPTSGATVNATTCVISGTSPVAYDPTCVGTVTVHLEVQPSTLTAPVDMTDSGTDLRNPG